ncbi:hypothetical protein ZIOFF_049862 [Zingiber officinale]|uniref:Uncharacterized protein n=1 Tax=Zingiber officinale TaxID=94328 RepID=A0A8J5FQ83_ZINOF|nr:hypothetical protein ZIOFF_049862 [Zingiber officinale]
MSFSYRGAWSNSGHLYMHPGAWPSTHRRAFLHRNMPGCLEQLQVPRIAKITWIALISQVPGQASGQGHSFVEKIKVRKGIPLLYSPPRRHVLPLAQLHPCRSASGHSRSAAPGHPCLSASSHSRRSASFHSYRTASIHPRRSASSQSLGAAPGHPFRSASSHSRRSASSHSRRSASSHSRCSASSHTRRPASNHSSFPACRRPTSCLPSSTRHPALPLPPFPDSSLDLAASPADQPIRFAAAPISTLFAFSTAA